MGDGEETSFKFKGYAKPSKLFDQDDDDPELTAGTSDASVSSASSRSTTPDRYHNPAELRLADLEDAVPYADAVDSENVHELDTERDEETAGCFKRVPDVALSSCVWIGSSLLSRMLFQIYNEMGDESLTSARLVCVRNECNGELLITSSCTESRMLFPDADFSLPPGFFQMIWPTRCMKCFQMQQR
jgi:hypothetical protein